MKQGSNDLPGRVQRSFGMCQAKKKGVEMAGKEAGNKKLFSFLEPLLDPERITFQNRFVGQIRPSHFQGLKHG